MEGDEKGRQQEADRGDRECGHGPHRFDTPVEDRTALFAIINDRPRPNNPEPYEFRCEDNWGRFCLEDIWETPRETSRRSTPELPAEAGDHARECVGSNGAKGLLAAHVRT